MFAREDGSDLVPSDVTKVFTRLLAAAGVRRVRLHDLRHGAASLMLAGGADIAMVSKRMGHSSIRVTADIYSHLLHGVGRQTADAAETLVPARGAHPEPDAPTLRPHGPADTEAASPWEGEPLVRVEPPVGIAPTTFSLRAPQVVHQAPPGTTVPDRSPSSEALPDTSWHRLGPGTTGYAVTIWCPVPIRDPACQRPASACCPAHRLGGRLGRRPRRPGGVGSDRDGVQAVLVPAGARRLGAPEGTMNGSLTRLRPRCRSATGTLGCTAERPIHRRW
ncbi:tyrosine-type recombinase/integrase [Modestobacter marinus]|uniref:tyrosine-type recombinase/integrase n=1 Tax=Modestobacter marinus TaxID=477641 RepID=UPI001C9879F1